MLRAYKKGKMQTLKMKVKAQVRRLKEKKNQSKNSNSLKNLQRHASSASEI